MILSYGSRNSDKDGGSIEQLQYKSLAMSQMKNQQDTETQLAVDLELHQFIVLASELLTDLIETEGEECQSIFNSQEIPSITLPAYLRRLHKYTQFSPQCIIMAIIYIDRYNMADSQFSLNWHNVHRILLSSLILAVKFHDDVYFDNLTFEKAGGVTAAYLFKFEVQIFEKIGNNAFVQEEEYQALVEKLYSVYGPDQE